MELGVKSEELRVKIIFQSSPKAIPLLHTPNFTLRLDKHPESRYNRLAIGVWRSLVSRLVRVQAAAGSNPATPTKNPVTAFAVTGFLINGGIRKTGHSKARVVGESIGFRAHPGGA